MEPRELVALTRFCREQAGEALRAVFTYTADSGHVLYAREDIQAAHGDGGLEPIREAAWHVHETVLAETPSIETVGEYRATIHTFDDVFVMQFRVSPDQGVAVSFDREIGQNLHEFVLDCQAHLQ